MLGLGVGEILMLAAVVLVFVGPERLPHLFRNAGRLYAQVRRASDDLRRAMVLEADRMDEEERLREAAERRKRAVELHEEARRSAGQGTVHQDAPLPRPSDEDVPMPDVLPEGVSADEWEHLPPHVKRLLLAERDVARP